MRYLLVILLLISCSKKEYDPRDDQALLCTCVENTTIMRSDTRQVLETRNNTRFGGCNESGFTTTEEPGLIIETRTQCNR